MCSPTPPTPKKKKKKKKRKEEKRLQTTPCAIDENVPLQRCRYTNMYFNDILFQGIIRWTFSVHPGGINGQAWLKNRTSYMSCVIDQNMCNCQLIITLMRLSVYDIRLPGMESRASDRNAATVASRPHWSIVTHGWKAGKNCNNAYPESLWNRVVVVMNGDEWANGGIPLRKVCIIRCLFEAAVHPAKTAVGMPVICK